MNELHLANNHFEILTDGETFVGLGKIRIGETLVRSGRLPLRPQFHSFDGWDGSTLLLREVQQNENEIRICTEVVFHPLPTKLMRDHSFDPIHDTSDWDTPPEKRGQLDIVLRPARDEFNGIQFDGFDYRYEYSSAQTSLFFILDKASWELDGDINGVTAVSQSSCSAPVVKFERETHWSTEGVIHFNEEAARQNPVMTHNLPRWASHGSFDFQYKGGSTLIGVFERVDLIRSLLLREAEQLELKCFDKHIFDQAREYSTSPKKILLNTEEKSESETAQRNLWTWIFDEVHDRARAEFGLYEEPVLPRVAHNFWHDFTIDSYFDDLLPAAENLDARSVFIDNLNKSDMTEVPPEVSKTGNMCCGHEYEPAPKLGGNDALKHLMDECRTHDIRVFAWTNNDQSYLSPINAAERDERNWFVKMEDARLKYGGAYTNVFSILDFKNQAPRRYWMDCLTKIKSETGLDSYLFDSFYNLGFMPINYSEMTPTTQWRELLGAFKALQDAGIHFMIESFGPFGEVQHGCPQSYNLENIFACYKINLGSGYTTVPTGTDTSLKEAGDAAKLYYVLAHMTKPEMPLFIEGERIDRLWSEDHKRALADYYENQPFMRRRTLLEDGCGVLWHDQSGQRATLWNFAERKLALPGIVTDATAGEELATAQEYSLRACHTYIVALEEGQKIEA